jgi:hypothetical protein
MMDQSRISAAQGAIAEVKARASSWYATQLMENATPTLVSVQGSVTSTPNVGNDFTVATAVGAGTTYMTITVSEVKGVAVSNVVGTWYMPQ